MCVCSWPSTFFLYCCVICIQILCCFQCYSTLDYYFGLIYSTAGNVSAGASMGWVSSSLLQMTSLGWLKKTATGSYGAACWLFAPREPNNNCLQRFLTVWPITAPNTRSLCAQPTFTLADTLSRGWRPNCIYISTYLTIKSLYEILFLSIHTFMNMMRLWSQLKICMPSLGGAGDGCTGL